MSQLCWYKVWDGSHEKFKRAVFILTLIDLLVICTITIYVGISLYDVTLGSPNSDIPIEHGEHNHSHHSEMNSSDINPLCDHDIADDEECRANLTRHFNATTRLFRPTPYFSVVGARIAKSVQLIIYTCQLFITVVLIRGLIRTDTQAMRTWLIVTEIITTIILLVLILVLFGNFNGYSVIITACYLIYQFIMIRTVARFIRRTEIELTQFGSIVEF